MFNNQISGFKLKKHNYYKFRINFRSNLSTMSTTHKKNATQKDAAAAFEPIYK